MRDQSGHGSFSGDLSNPAVEPGIPDHHNQKSKKRHNGLAGTRYKEHRDVPACPDYPQRQIPQPGSQPLFHWVQNISAPTQLFLSAAEEGHDQHIRQKNPDRGQEHFQARLSPNSGRIHATQVLPPNTRMGISHAFHPKRRSNRPRR